MSSKFLRSDTSRHLRLGKKRRKLQKWRNPRGRHNKIRRQRRNYPLRVKIGFKGPVADSGKVEGYTPVLVHNIKEVSSLKKGSIVILARIGARKKLEVIKKADELGLRILNAGGKMK